MNKLIKIILIIMVVAIFDACKKEDVLKEKSVEKPLIQKTKSKQLVSIVEKVDLFKIIQQRNSTNNVINTETEKEILHFYDSLASNITLDSLRMLNDFIKRGGEINISHTVNVDIPTNEFPENEIDNLKIKTYVDLYLDIYLNNDSIEILNLEEIKNELVQENEFKLVDNTFSKLRWRPLTSNLKSANNRGSIFSVKDLIKFALTNANSSEIEKLFSNYNLKIDKKTIENYRILTGINENTLKSGGTDYSKKPLSRFADYSKFDNGDILIARCSKKVPGYYSHGGMFDKKKHDQDKENGIDKKNIYCVLTANPKGGKKDNPEYASDRPGYVCYDKVRVFTHSAACIRLWPLKWTPYKAKKAIEKAREFYDAKIPYGWFLPYKKDRKQSYTKKMYCTRVPWLGWISQDVNIECDFKKREIYRFCDIIYPDNIYNGCFKSTRTTCWSILWWSKCSTKIISNQKNYLHSIQIR